MRINIFVERNTKNPALWNGFIKLHHGKDSLTVQGEYNHQSPNGAWDEVIRELQHAIDQAEIDAPQFGWRKDALPSDNPDICICGHHRLDHYDRKYDCNGPSGNPMACDCDCRGFERGEE